MGYTRTMIATIAMIEETVKATMELLTIEIQHQHTRNEKRIKTRMRHAYNIIKHNYMNNTTQEHIIQT